MATELLLRSVALVVAMSHSVLLKTAEKFVAAFSTELAKGQRVDQASLPASGPCTATPIEASATASASPASLIGLCLCSTRRRTTPQLFTAIPAPQTTEDIKVVLRKRLGEVPLEPVDTGFEGRSRDLLALERLRRQERWALVRGQGGEGKTALAAELARWLVRFQQVKRAAYVSVELCSHGAPCSMPRAAS